MTDTAQHRPNTTHTAGDRPVTVQGVICSRCGTSYAVTSREIRDGTWLSRCPTCRTGNERRDAGRE